MSFKQGRNPSYFQYRTLKMLKTEGPYRAYDFSQADKLYGFRALQEMGLAESKFNLHRHETKVQITQKGKQFLKDNEMSIYEL